MDEAIANFVGITGASEDAARQILDMCGGDLSQAVPLWFSDEELQRNLSNPTPPTAAASAGTPAAAAAAAAVASSSSSSGAARPPTSRQARRAAARRRQVGRQDASGVIHIDSDDEDDGDDGDNGGVEYLGSSSRDVMDLDDDEVEAVTVARTAQEEEDAAMAKRLQEELYQGQAVDEEGVRAPMARTTETLVAPSGSWGLGGDMDDVNMAIQEQLRRRRQAAHPRGNPFAQSIWEDDSSSPAAPRPSAGGLGPSSRAQRLAELFRPPYDLMAHLDWDGAREQGKEDKKWILVNLQDMSDFNCQALNRDIWKDEAVRQLVSEHFLFLQFSKDDPRADQYVTFYLPNGQHENPDNYPHVSIVDPRTGEQVKVWSGRPFPSASAFHAELVEFLDRYSLAAHSKNPIVKTKRPERVLDVDRMTEEEMLEMALQNSLESNGNAKPSVYDPDELTRSFLADDGDKGKGKATAGEEEAAAAAEPSAFSRIASDRPHVEPENDPQTTTRIQFRHPDGRVIRRFRLDDRVARLYEWLKAEPLEGREGVEFELKVMPQGHDLMEDLDKTVEEAGLKQGTVMIEFLEE